MYPVFEDSNADLLAKIAKTIQPVEHFAVAPSQAPLDKAEHPLTSQFFPQPEVSIAHLDTPLLIETMAGGKSPLNERFRAAMQAAYPLTPELWAMKPPEPVDTGVGGMSSRWRQDKAANGSLSKSASAERESLRKTELALVRNEIVRAIVKAVDAGQIDRKAAYEALKGWGRA